MSNAKDDFETFQDFCDLWDAASSSDQFKNAVPPKPQNSQVPAGFLNLDLDLEEEEMDPENADDPYYNYASVIGEDGLIQESKLNKRKQLSEQKKPEPAANPIWPDSIGKDQDQPVPVWNTTDIFKEIEDLKRKLYEAECKANEQDAGGKKWHAEPPVAEGKRLFDSLAAIRKQIDELSDTLGLKDEPNSKSPTWSFKS